MEGEEESKDGEQPPTTAKSSLAVFHMGGPEPLSRVGLAEKVGAGDPFRSLYVYMV